MVWKNCTERELTLKIMFSYCLCAEKIQVTELLGDRLQSKTSLKSHNVENIEAVRKDLSTSGLTGDSETLSLHVCQ